MQVGLTVFPSDHGFFGDPQDIQVRVQTRKVTFADVLYKGKVISTAESIQNLKDEYDPNLGAEIAVGRAMKKLFGETHKVVTEEVIEKLEDKAFHGALKLVKKLQSMFPPVFTGLDTENWTNLPHWPSGSPNVQSPPIPGNPGRNFLKKYLGIK